MSSKTATQTKKKATTPKAAKNEQEISPIDEKARAAGTALVDLFGNTKGLPAEVTPAKKLAAKLADATATNADLVSLRDLTNAAAAALREKQDGDTAKKLSDLNRNVRRAERATRA
jgi:hypothetical protein